MDTGWTLPAPLSSEILATMAESLLTEIYSAFAGVSIKGGVTLTEAYAIDDYEDDATRAAARAQDTYTDWTKIDVPRLDPGDSALCFVDPIGFRFHLPAYMCHVIKQNRHTLSGFLDTERLVDHLQVANDFGKRLTADFDESQLTACARFLVFIAEEKYSSDSEFAEDRERLAKDVYDYQSPLRIMRVAWWKHLTNAERQSLIARWPILREDPY